MPQEPRSEQRIGDVLPDFTLTSVATPGAPWSLHEMAKKDRGAVLMFWSGVCSHCRRYDGYLNAFVGRHPELAFAAIASRQGESLEDVRSVAASRSLGFPILHDPGSVVAGRLFAQQTPRALLVDADARLVYRGAIDNFKYEEDPDYEPYLEPAIESFLAGRPVARPDTASFGCSITSIYYTIPVPLKKL
jgi:thiol-disulfide isomerase/thioredoxin